MISSMTEIELCNAPLNECETKNVDGLSGDRVIRRSFQTVKFSIIQAFHFLSQRYP